MGWFDPDEKYAVEINGVLVTLESFTEMLEDFESPRSEG